MVYIHLMGVTLTAGSFEWDAAKAATNLTKHNVSFEDAIVALVDEDAIVDLDTASGEERFIVIGLSIDKILCVVTVERGETTRIISARHATRAEVRRYQFEER